MIRQCARPCHKHNHDFSCRFRPADNDMADNALMLFLIIWGNPVLHKDIADFQHNAVIHRQFYAAIRHIHDFMAALLIITDYCTAFLEADRHLDFVSVLPWMIHSDNRIDLDAFQPADALQYIADLFLLRAQLAFIA